MNIKKSVVNIICRVGDKTKPMLLKIFPGKFFRELKGKILRTAYNGTSEKLPYEKGAFPFGVNLVGFIKAQMGLGQGCRLIASALEKAEIPFGAVDTRVGNPFSHSDKTWEHKLNDSFGYSVNIFHVNPEQMPYLQISLPADVLDRHYNIGIWLWELPDFPDRWCESFRLVDEVWAPSVFNCESIRRKSPVPVTLIPYGIEAETDEKMDRAYFGLPEGKFLFLSMFDSNSTIERKNPLGAVRAFRKAFSPTDSGVGLVIKMNNPNDGYRKLLLEEIQGYPDIYLIEKSLTKTEVNSLIASANVFVSLHRAEGFGLVIAEAMYLGTPVIATNWSANVDFMTEENSCPVNFKLREIGRDIFFYEAYQFWAEPDLNHAAEYMKKLFSDREFYNFLRKNAMAYIRENYSTEKSAAAIKKRLSEILR